MYKQQTLIVSLNFTKIINLFFKSDWLITMLFQCQQRFWPRNMSYLVKSGSAGLRVLRRHCITHQHDSFIDITKWAQEYFQKPLSVNTVRRAICRCQLNLYHAKRKPYVNMVQKRRCVLWDKAHLKRSVSKWKSVLWSDESKFDILVVIMGTVSSRLKRRETFQRVISAQFKREHLWWYGCA